MINYNALSRLFIWLGRMGCCRGFGIQSPWAYSFVRYVVNEHYPYYGYVRLRRMFPRSSVCARKLGEFFLRLSNFLQPSQILSLYDFDDGLEKFRKEYFTEGCHRTVYISVNVALDGFTLLDRNENDGALIVRCGADVFSEDFVLSTVGKLKKGDVILVEDLYSSKDSRRDWMLLSKNLKGVLMFDLYYCGVVYVDPDRYLEHFKINF